MENDLIRRADVVASILSHPGRFAGQTEGDVRKMIAGWIEAVDAAQVVVKPLEWRATVDGAYHDHGVTVAYCPVFEKRFWAESPDKQPKIEAKRAASIRSALA